MKDLQILTIKRDGRLTRVCKINSEKLEDEMSQKNYCDLQSKPEYCK